MNRWFHFQFRFYLAEGNRPRWWLDLLTLDFVVRDVLELKKQELVLWRFHRRCNPQDDAGHQFTFLAYTDESTADQIDTIIQEMEILQFLDSNGALREYLLNRKDHEDIHLVEGTSDKSWPVEIQKAWPYFIMGASEMVLDLLHQARDEGEPPSLSERFDAIEIYYDNLAERLNEMWQQHGSHAYLHHLNALFGYVPLLVRPRSLSGALMTL